MLRISNGLLAFFVCLTLGTVAQADPTFTFTGTFGSDEGSTTGLANGSFSVTYQIASFPGTSGGEAQTFFDSFTVSLYSSSNTLVSSYTEANALNDSNSYVEYSPGYPAYGVPPSDFTNIENPANPVTYLQLNLPTGFNGSATLGSKNLADSIETYLGNQVFITSAIGAPLASVPEPSSLVMAGLGLAGLAGYGWRRRRAIV